MNIIDVTNTIPQTNYSKRTIVPLGIVYHITTDNKKGISLGWFQNPKAIASAQYIVEPDGDVHLCVYPNQKAYHAGVKKYPTAQIIKDNGNRNPNDYLIGIEVVSKKNGALTKEQYDSLKKLTIMLSEEYNIKLDRYHLIGHNEINTIDKVFCPVSVYNPSEVIQAIEHDKKINNLNDKINKLQNDSDEQKEEIGRLEGIIKKVRIQYKQIYRMYKARTEELQKLQGRR